MKNRTMTGCLTDIKTLETELPTFLRQIGNGFKIFELQDSGCVSYGVEVDGMKLFVKYAHENSTDGRGSSAVLALHRAIAFHQAVQHPNIPTLLNHFSTQDGLVLVYAWAEGEVLASPEFPDRRTNPASPYFRFQRLDPALKLQVLNALYDAHRTIFEAGYIAVDCYLGCIIYDFERNHASFFDFDEYHASGPFILETDRLPGSRSLMAPEEFIRGSRIDQVTNVFVLGKIALALLGEEQRDKHFWQGPAALYEVVHKATEIDRLRRYPSFEAFFTAWLENLAH